MRPSGIDFGECVFYVDGKAVGAAKKCSVAGPPSEAKRPPQRCSFTCRMDEEESRKMQWLLGRPERIRKYIKQIFRLWD